MSYKHHKYKYEKEAFLQYSFSEFGAWIHNLMKRATHRNLLSKDGRLGCVKDLQDAQNYVDMLQEKLNHERDILLHSVNNYQNKNIDFK